jgi:hypothetical protein
MPENLIKLQFVGHTNVPEKMERKNTRFIIGVEQNEFNLARKMPYPSTITATVIDGKGIHPDGIVKEFVNPYLEFHETMSPTFMRVLV